MITFNVFKLNIIKNIDLINHKILYKNHYLYILNFY